MNVFPYFKQQMENHGTDAVDLDTDTIKCMLVNGYTYNAAHKYVSDLTGAVGASVIQRSGAITGVTLTISGNVVNFSHADVTLATVPTGHTVTQVVYYKDTGLDTSSVLICDVDQDNSSVALSVPTNGSDIVVHAPSGVFDL